MSKGELWARILPGKSFSGVAPGEIWPREYEGGDIVDGELAAIAIKQGLAEKGDGPRPLDPEIVEEKMLKGAPENRDMGESALGQRLRFLQAENAKLGEAAARMGRLLRLLGLDDELVSRIESGEAEQKELEAVEKQIETARAGAGKGKNGSKGSRK